MSFLHWFFCLGQKPRAPEAGSCLVQEQEVWEVRSYNLSVKDHQEAPANSRGVPGLGLVTGCSLWIASFLKKSLFYYSYPSLWNCSGLSGNTWFMPCHDCMLGCLGFQALVLYSHSPQPRPDYSSLPLFLLVLLSVCVRVCVCMSESLFSVSAEWCLFVSGSSHPAVPMSKQFGINYIHITATLWTLKTATLRLGTMEEAFSLQ